MKKIFVIFGICIVLLASGAFAYVSDVQGFAEKIVKVKGIDNVKDVRQVSFDNLPGNVDIKNIDETNLALYEIDTGQESPVYVVSVSEEKFKRTVQEYVDKMFLNFGSNSQISNPGFLGNSVGVLGEEKGYVMMRDGSITGISTNLEFLKVEDVSNVEIIIYINGEAVGFRNGFLGEEGIFSDYDVISENTLNFEAGDVISVYVNIDGKVLIDDITTLIEIEVKS